MKATNRLYSKKCLAKPQDATAVVLGVAFKNPREFLSRTSFLLGRNHGQIEEDANLQQVQDRDKALRTTRSRAQQAEHWNLYTNVLHRLICPTFQKCTRDRPNPKGDESSCSWPPIGRERAWPCPYSFRQYSPDTTVSSQSLIEDTRRRRNEEKAEQAIVSDTYATGTMVARSNGQFVQYTSCSEFPASGWRISGSGSS
jgi:hypothetical protein